MQFASDWERELKRTHSMSILGISGHHQVIGKLFFVQGQSGRQRANLITYLDARSKASRTRSRRKFFISYFKV